MQGSRDSCPSFIQHIALTLTERTAALEAKEDSNYGPVGVLGDENPHFLVVSMMRVSQMKHSSVSMPLLIVDAEANSASHFANLPFRPESLPKLISALSIQLLFLTMPHVLIY